jgi:2-dehydro-3-deoxy-D-gluconate 5-dehydrogenase
LKPSLAHLFSLEGRVAVVTGGNGGIGKGIACGLAGAGASVVIAARNEARTAAAVAELQSDYGVEALGVEADVRQEKDNVAMVDKALDRFGRVDMLVCNAGIGKGGPPQDMTILEWDEILETNLRSFFLAARAAYPAMVRQGGGKIISVGSLTSLMAIEGAEAYGASKGGVLQLTRSLAVSWAKDNIQVNCILPGWITTDMTQSGRSRPGRARGIADRTPAGRWGQPDDFAGPAVFLASHASDFVTGAALMVDGGYSVQVLWANA